ncbi:lysine-specific demethylase 5A-like isoform X6 [Babesia caballi]|uniref:Lysine-specific demethylase 5A-like isoform X6 n=1 Tax=Babesia caballi TaxID=5871 RepID=A0AAV4LW23_BABCB|nr:lysine-specific demethylase 5A-like isoform X6 [Babesia caballi]
MTSDFALDSKAIERYCKQLEAWQRVQANVESNLRALVILLDKFLLFAGAEEGNSHGHEANVDRLLDSYVGGGADALPDAYEEAVDRLAAIKEFEQSDINAVSPLTANIQANLPGSIALFLQRQSDKMLQIMCEIRAECETFRCVSLPKMEPICDAAIAHINRNSVSLESQFEKAALADAIYRSFTGIVHEINALLELVASLDSYPADRSRIQACIDQISTFKLRRVEEHRAIISSY